MLDHYIIVVTSRLYHYGISFPMKKTELEMARDQLAEISKTLEGNEWFDYIASHLLPVHFELERQLSHEEE